MFRSNVTFLKIFIIIYSRAIPAVVTLQMLNLDFGPRLHDVVSIFYFVLFLAWNNVHAACIKREFEWKNKMCPLRSERVHCEIVFISKEANLLSASELITKIKRGGIFMSNFVCLNIIDWRHMTGRVTTGNDGTFTSLSITAIDHD